MEVTARNVREPWLLHLLGFVFYLYCRLNVPKAILADGLGCDVCRSGDCIFSHLPHRHIHRVTDKRTWHSLILRTWQALWVNSSIRNRNIFPLMASGFSQASDCWIMGKNCTGDMGQNPPIFLIPQRKAWRFTLWPGKPGRHLGALHGLDSPAGWAFDSQGFHILVLLLPRGRWSIYLFWPLFNSGNSPLTSINTYKGLKSYCSFFYIFYILYLQL